MYPQQYSAALFIVAQSEKTKMPQFNNRSSKVYIPLNLFTQQKELIY